MTVAARSGGCGNANCSRNRDHTRSLRNSAHWHVAVDGNVAVDRDVAVNGNQTLHGDGAVNRHAARDGDRALIQQLDLNVQSD